jgi:signal transduction histidine kinase
MSQTNPKYRRLEALFSGARPPVQPAPHREPAEHEADSLKARIKELEARLEQQPQKPETAAEIRAVSAAGEQAQGTEGRRPRDRKFNWFWDLARSPSDDDPSYIGLIRTILIFTLAANLAVLVATSGVLGSIVRIGTLVILGILAFLVAAALYLTYRKTLLPAKLILPVALVFSVTYIAIKANGLHDSAIAGFGFSIVIGSMLLGYRGVVPVAVMAIFGVFYIGYADFTGITQSAMARKTGWDDILVISTLLITSAALLRGLIRRLNEATDRAREKEWAQTLANRELRGLQETLENRIEDRTRALELAGEVGRTITGRVSKPEEMLTEAAEMICARFGLHYTQVYLADPAGRILTLHTGTGEVGTKLLKRGHRLPIDPGSLNGQAALQRKPVIVADTLQHPNFKPNPLLPNTRSEIAVPLIIGGQVIGVLDMQSDQPGALNETNLPAFEALAGQLAVALQNASLFGQVEQARAEVEAQMRGLTQRGWTEFMNAIDRGERIGYAYDQVRAVPLKEAALAPASGAAAVSIPIQVTGAKVGMIQLVNHTDRDLSADQKELLRAAANQLAGHIENLRLLAQAEGYRAEAEQALRRLTREGWDLLQLRSDLAPGYAFTLNEVIPLSNTRTGSLNAALKQPLSIRDETIGEVYVEQVGRREGAAEIVGAVARQLSAHLENLRLSEQNEKRALEMETVADLSATTSTVLEPDRLLQSVVDLTKESFGIYHAHIYLADDESRALRLAAGAGETGQKMAVQGHAIPFDAERSLVARAARERTSVIVNDVRAEPGFLPNPLLPETRSEMAVPMIVGDKVLGVFDVQADKAENFTNEDANIYTTLASQVGVALQNARLYAEQAATVSQLRELDRLKSSFLANMSHELRTPLNSILGFADVILEELDGPLTENMTNDLQLIQKNGQHLLHLINDVLDMAKIEAGRMNLTPEKFRVQEILEEVLGITSTLASEKNLSLLIEQDSDRQVEITADRTRLRQVMINLVNNSIKFTEKGGIFIHAACQDDHVVIRVKDSGIGIPTDKIEEVFQEFAQVDSSTTRKTGGTGLGLPISRKLIEMHGGRLWAESSGVEHEGSTFYVELPLESHIAEPAEKVEK